MVLHPPQQVALAGIVSVCVVSDCTLHLVQQSWVSLRVLGVAWLDVVKSRYVNLAQIKFREFCGTGLALQTSETALSLVPTHFSKPIVSDEPVLFHPDGRNYEHIWFLAQQQSPCLSQEQLPSPYQAKYRV